jgi:predicted nucleotidyltransferase
MLDRRKVVEAFGPAGKALESHGEIACAYAFGSALDQSRERIRDVDVAVLGREPLSLERIGALVLELSPIFETDRIDIVDLATARRALRHEALRGVLLAENSAREAT